MYNPVDVIVKMKMVETKEGRYYIGNCGNIDINIKNTVLRLFEPTDGKRKTVLIIQPFDSPEKSDEDSGM